MDIKRQLTVLGRISGRKHYFFKRNKIVCLSIKFLEHVQASIDDAIEKYNFEVMDIKRQLTVLGRISGRKHYLSKKNKIGKAIVCQSIKVPKHVQAAIDDAIERYNLNE